MQNRRSRGWVRRLAVVGRRLVEPSSDVVDQSDRRSARLLSTLLLLIAPLGLASVTAQLWGGTWSTALFAVVFAVVALVAAYLLSRTKCWQIAGAITTLVPTAGGVAVVLADPVDPGWFAFMSLSPLLGAWLMPTRGSLVLAAANIAVVVVIVVSLPSLPSATGAVAIMFNVIVSVIVQAASHHRNRLERERRAELLASQRIHNSMLRGAFGGIAILERGVIAEANALFWSLLGADATARQRRPFSDFFEARSADELAEVIALADGHPVEMNVRRSDGWAFVIEILVRSSDDAVRVVALRDLTARRTTGRALARAHEMESVGMLAATLAHDTNNEVFVISVLASQARREAIMAGQPIGDIERIEESAGRIAMLARRVLSAGRDVINDPTDVDIPTFIGECRPLWEHVLGNRVELQITSPLEPGSVVIDRAQLEQVMINLLLNALDAMGGSGRLRVGAGRVELDEPDAQFGTELMAGTYRVITVGDSGGGIDPLHLPYIFDAAFSTKDGLSAGLGLYASREIVRDAGGALGVVSGPGGSTFSVVLPEWSAPTASWTSRAGGRVAATASSRDA